MPDKKHGISLFLACCTGILGLGLFSLPTAVAHFGSTVYWLCLLGGMLLALAASTLCAAAFPSSFYSTCKTKLPKLAKPLTALYTLFCTALTALLFAYYAHTVQGWFLDGVPRALIALFLIAICLWTAIKPLRTVLRLVSVCACFILPAVLIMRCIMLFSGDLRGLLPVWETAQLPAIPRGSIFTAAFFLLPSIIGFVAARRRTKLFASGGAIVFCTLIFILATAACISILGPLQTAQHLSSTVLAMKNLRLSKLDFFQRGDIVFILTWTVLILSAGSLSAHLPYAVLRELCPRAKSGWLYAAFFAVYATVAFFVPSEESALLLLIYTTLLGSGIFCIALPILLLLKPRGVKHHRV